METRRRWILPALIVGLAVTGASEALAQKNGRGPGGCPQCPMGGSCPMPQGKGMRGGRAGDPGFARDRDVFHRLLAQHKKIRRTVQVRPDGVETLTESEDPAVVALLKEHVPAMYARLREGRPVHQVDPLFVALFRHGKKIEAKVEPTEKGVRVIETSKEAYVVKLIQAHARSVDELVAQGMAGLQRLHEVPKP